MFQYFLLLGKNVIVLILIFLFLFFQQKVIHMLFQSSQLAPHYSNCGCYCQTAEMHKNWLEKQRDYSHPHTLFSLGAPHQCWWEPVNAAEVRAHGLFSGRWEIKTWLFSKLEYKIKIDPQIVLSLKMSIFVEWMRCAIAHPLSHNPVVILCPSSLVPACLGHPWYLSFVLWDMEKSLISLNTHPDCMIWASSCVHISSVQRKVSWNVEPSKPHGS